MKKIIIFCFLLFFCLSYSQEQTQEELDKELDSLNINHHHQFDDLIIAKNNLTDLFNILIYNGDYSKILISKFVKEVNSSQKFLEISNDIYSEKNAIEKRDAIITYFDLTIKAKKNRLLADKYLELAANEEKKQNDRVLLFLRESNFSPSEFKKLSGKDKENLLLNYEMSVDGISNEIIEYYNNLNSKEKEFLNNYVKGDLSPSIDNSKLSIYNRLINDKIIYSQTKYSSSNSFYLTEKKGKPIYVYLTKYKKL